MKDEIERLTGRWWFHGKEKPAVHGVLEIGGGRLLLKLDILKDPTAQDDILIVDPSETWPTLIHGRDRHDAPITLFGCGRPEWRQSVGMLSYEISALAALREQQLDSWAQPYFKTAIIELEHLARWLNQPYVDRVDIVGSGQALIAAKFFEANFELEDGVRVSFEQSTCTRSSWDEESFRPSAQIAFYFSTMRSVQEIMDRWVPWAQRLVGLLVGTGVGRKKVRFFRHDASQANLPLHK